jgi:hypothetical protein
MKYLLAVIVTAFLSSCATPTASTTSSAPPASGAGSSYQTAIVVPATNEVSGVAFEYDYIRAHYPKSKFVSQALSQHGGKPYDIMTFATADGKKRTLYFEISRYFGRY